MSQATTEDSDKVTTRELSEGELSNGKLKRDSPHYPYFAEFQAVLPSPGLFKVRAYAENGILEKEVDHSSWEIVTARFAKLRPGEIDAVLRNTETGELTPRTFFIDIIEKYLTDGKIVWASYNHRTGVDAVSGRIPETKQEYYDLLEAKRHP